MGGAPPPARARGAPPPPHDRDGAKPLRPKSGPNGCTGHVQPHRPTLTRPASTGGRWEVGRGSYECAAQASVRSLAPAACQRGRARRPARICCREGELGAEAGRAEQLTARPPNPSLMPIDAPASHVGN